MSDYEVLDYIPLIGDIYRYGKLGYKIGSWIANNEDDYNDRYKFGCLYIDNKNNPTNYSMRMDLKRGYSTGNGEKINGWVYIKIESSES